MDAGLNRVPLIDLQLSDITTAKRGIRNQQQIATELCDILKTTGFLYFINHGIEQQKVDDVFELSKQYFKLPVSTKEQIPHTKETYVGYSSIGKQVVNKENVPECRESYDTFLPSDVYPKEPKNFKTISDALINDLVELFDLVMKLLSEGLGLPPNALADAHKNRQWYGFKMNHYPAIGEDQPNVIRMGAHSDFSTMTLLLQEEHGGLMAQKRNGEWVEAVPMPGAIFFNIGKLLEIWTGGVLEGTMHEVPHPTTPSCRSRHRYSLVMFCVPDEDAIVEPLIGDNNKYKAVNSTEYVFGLQDETYM